MPVRMLAVPGLVDLTRSVPGLSQAVHQVVERTRIVLEETRVAVASPGPATAALASGAMRPVAALVRNGRRSAEQAARLPALLADVAATVADAGQHRDRRRLWAHGGKAHIEVRGLITRGQVDLELSRALTTELRWVKGVSWAEVNIITAQVLIAYDEDHIDLDGLLDVVEAVEEVRGTDEVPFQGMRPHHPFETAPATLAAATLVADCLGMAIAATARLTPVPLLPRALRVPLVIVDTQPRLRRLLESRLGPAHTDALLALANAALHALSGGVAPLGLDAAQRLLLLAEIHSRQDVWNRREAELVPPGAELPWQVHEPVPRPAPLPPGPVETGSARSALATAAAAAVLLAVTRSPARAGEAILATVPKAARVGRETFAALMARDLAHRGVVPMDAAAFRKLDRVSAVVIDSMSLCASRPRLLSAVTTGDLDEPELWAVVHSLLAGRSVEDLAGDGPWIDEGWRLERAPDAPGGRPDAATALVLDLFDADGRRQGRVRVGCELDPLADALVGAARTGAELLVLTEHASTTALLPWADEVLPAAAAPVLEVRRLQAEGQGVLMVASGYDDALEAADVGIALLRPAGTGLQGVSWSADLFCGPGLAAAWRVLHALGEARRVSDRSARLAVGGSVLGALLAGVGAGRRPLSNRINSPVYGAAVMAQFVATAAARRLAKEPVPPPRPHGEWHSLGAREAYLALRAGRQDDQDRQRQKGPEDSGAPRGGGLRRVAEAAVRSPAGALVLLPARRAGSLLGAVREELRDPLTPVLALGAAASAVVGSNVDALLVAGVMVGNALISATQRLRAERALRGLLLGERVNARRVRWAPPEGEAARGGEPGESFFAGLEDAPVEIVAAEDLVPGDVIALGPSDVVPADARLVAATDLEIDEATLTGESVPVAKQTRPTPGADLADRTSMVYEGSTVLAGSGFAVVVATGPQTEAGLAADAAGRAGAPVGIEGHLAKLTRVALPATALGGTAVTVLALLRGAGLREALASGVAIAVAAVPEGLPLVATVAQSAAARRLSGRGVLVRSARVLEALGRVDVVCFDKTGTLTEGRLSVSRVAGFDRETPLDSPLGRRLLRAAYRASPHQEADSRALAHATDRAIVDAVAALGIDDSDWRLVDELPFETSRGYSASLGVVSGKPYLAVKGAPETVLEQCATVLGSSGHDTVVPFTPSRRRAAGALLNRLASDGLRVLAIAESEQPSLDVPADTGVAGLVTDLTLVGFVAIADTVRPGAAEAVRRLAEAGVRVTMVTGDHPTTAAAIARELGVPDSGPVLTGAELDALTERDRVARVAGATVFARVSPEQKIRIVQALQRAGHVVAMAGDGTNDAAAIRLADVGIGVSARGSTSARTASDLVLTEPDLTRLIDALLEGRTLWGNVRDAVAILVGGNAGEIAFTVLGTALAGRAPLSTRQLLLVNMLTDMLPALAVALAPAKPEVLGGDRLAEGPVSSLLGPDLARILAVRGGTTALGAMAAWQLGRMTGRSRRASTMGLAALVCTQLGQTLITDWHSLAVIATSALSTIMLAVVIETPLVSHFFGSTPLGPVAWGIVFMCAATATAGAALAPRLLFRSPEPAAEG